MQIKTTLDAVRYISKHIKRGVDINVVINKLEARGWPLTTQEKRHLRLIIQG